MGKIKLAGTPLDRRSKAAYKKDEIVKYYKSHDLSMEEVGYIFGISRMQVWRYLHYDKYLQQCRKDSLKYLNKLKEDYPTQYQIQKQNSKLVNWLYEQYLIDAKNSFDVEKAFNKHFNKVI